MTRRRARLQRMLAIAAPLVAVVLTHCGAKTGLDDDLESASTSGDGAASADAVSEDAAPRLPCVPGPITLTRARPAVMFVLDRSRSMAETLSGRSRWAVLTDALASTLPSVDDTMQLGAVIFPASGTGGQSCAVPTAPDLALATNNVGGLISRMRAQGPNGSTPTADALDVAGTAIANHRAAQTARALVLATDGAPGCNASLDPKTCRCLQGTRCNTAVRCLDDERTVARVKAIADRGIPTYVVGIQSGANVEYSDVLDAMAVAGGRPRNGTSRYYAASSAADLDNAFSAIRNQIGACTFLTTSVPSADGSITIIIDGKVVPFSPNGDEGWRWANEANGEILLIGATCPDADAEPSVVADVACGKPEAGTDAGTDAEPHDSAAAAEGD